MSEVSAIVGPSGTPARDGASSLFQFWKRYGAALLFILPIVDWSSNLWLNSTYAKKEEVKEVRQLVYDRTRPITERVGNLETKLSGIETKLDERAKLQDERSKREERDSDEIKADLRDIQTFLRTPRAGSR